MDDLAARVGMDPLAFRLEELEGRATEAVSTAAAERSAGAEPG